jgi:hypothetical protein
VANFALVRHNMLRLSAFVQHLGVDDDRTRRTQLLVCALRGTAVPINVPLAKSTTRRILFATVSFGVRHASDLHASLGFARPTLDSILDVACSATCP